MINKFYSIDWALEKIPTKLDNIFTPAEIMESMCTHFKDPLRAIEHMVQKTAAKQTLLDKKMGTILDLFKEGDQVVTEPVSEDKPAEPEKKIEPVKQTLNAPVKQEIEYGWSSANFTDAEFLPGGNMPGDLGIRSPVDLNLMKHE